MLVHEIQYLLNISCPRRIYPEGEESVDISLCTSIYQHINVRD